ncbi:hypothetical protein JG688_00002853 [Phytophthora aleatoria]|uniref:Uncharacterized protein n=1 Tax=Phytophthora aleatoria TaxID=2496075 RepID=A0A8J5IU43_9STRA|nr:hypothetical protein JG688_00002853 [Phytophthora aleatoria]
MKQRHELLDRLRSTIQAVPEFCQVRGVELASQWTAYSLSSRRQSLLETLLKLQLLCCDLSKQPRLVRAVGDPCEQLATPADSQGRGNNAGGSLGNGRELSQLTSEMNTFSMQSASSCSQQSKQPVMSPTNHDDTQTAEAHAAPPVQVAQVKDAASVPGAESAHKGCSGISAHESERLDRLKRLLERLAHGFAQDQMQ